MVDCARLHQALRRRRSVRVPGNAPTQRADTAHRQLPHRVVETAKGRPCTHNPLVLKGGGEAGAFGSPPAVVNAIRNVIRNAIGVKNVHMPAIPHTVWQAADGAQ
jgi:hypothetical protein